MGRRVRVTVGLPFLNAAGTLMSAIQSVFAQTYEDWELLLVDDGSTDGGLQLIRQITDPRVRVVSDGVRKGLAKRLNLIARLAQGEYVARLDADDMMHPERLERQVSFLERHPTVQVLGTATYVIDTDNRVTGFRRSGPISRDAESLLARAIFVHPTVMARRSWLVDHPYDPVFTRAEDHELWIRTYEADSFAALDEALYFYREIGVFNLQKYVASARTERKIIVKYGPSRIGYVATGCLLIRTFAKEAGYRLFGAAGAADYLVRRRSLPVGEADRRSAEFAISQVLNTCIPGVGETMQGQAWGKEETRA